MGAFEALISGVIVVILAGVVFSLVPFGLAYVALRVRDQRHAKADPELGLKSAFHLVHSIAVLMVLAGLSLSAVDLMEGKLSGNQKNPQPQANPFAPPRPAPAPKDEFWTAAQRSAAALVATGALFGLIFWSILRTGTNNRKYTAPQRTFIGGRLAVSLLIMFAAFTTVTVSLVQKDPKLESVEAAVGVLAIWLPGAAVHMYLFQQAAKQPTEPATVAETEAEDDE